MPSTTVYLSLLVAVVSAVLWNNSRKRSRLPPGPTGLPIIGNVLDMAVTDVHVAARKWSEDYGDDVISVATFGHPTIILNSSQAVNDLLVGRGANYSSRPHMPMIVDLVGWDWTFALMPYGPVWKEHRRIFHNQFNATIHEHRQIQEPAAAELLLLLLRTPERFLDHLEHYTARIIMQRVYGYTDFKDAMEDYFVTINKQASESTAIATMPGTFLVDTFPILKYAPEWMPGAGFKTIAKKWRALQEIVRNKPFKMVLDQRATGTANPSFVNTCLEDRMIGAPDALSEEAIKNIAAVVYAAGSDTNLASLTVFVLSMMMHPEVQKKAQQELDSVLGGERLPTFNDIDQLPYLWNVMREVFRWIVVFPFAIPHQTMKEDVYKGYYIPAGATVIGNSWAILHNPAVYPDPESFKPERYEDKNVPDPIDNGVFGFGRRSCSGKAMAIDTVWIAMATVLSAYDICMPVDENGKPIVPEVKFRRTTIKHVAPFKCVFKARSKGAVNLMKQEVERLVRDGSLPAFVL
ncbi:unnamed protein product [Cyclocybe aegerita]|uniref:Cytochrome P450 n=1 Tax=Cyclocybe aegerita TaxID=1973307 RepID=A0A8S0VT56_CYCAE|nr:unnamed protein product [Cyclocybe aegerita]